MSLSFCLLASGSKGNALVVKAGSQCILIDAGITARQVKLRMEAAGLSPAELTAVVVTHEHTDHVAGVRVLAKQLGIEVYATEATGARSGHLAQTPLNRFEAGRELLLGQISLQPFSIPHDAADPVGLVIRAGKASLGVATDLGKATALVRARLAGCRALILEANHDPEMLAQGSYPQWLKQRVRSSHGHLSNPECAELLTGLHHDGLQQIVLAHLSEQNNRPNLAETAARDVLTQLESRAGLTVASQHKSTRIFEIE